MKLSSATKLLDDADLLAFAFDPHANSVPNDDYKPDSHQPQQQAAELVDQAQ
jgi:hypothetical protein